MFPPSLPLLRGSTRLRLDRGGRVPGPARRFPDRFRSFLADAVIFQTKSGTFPIWFAIAVISFASVEISSVMNEGSFVIFQISFAISVVSSVISVISFIANELSGIAYRGEACRIEASKSAVLAGFAPSDTGSGAQNRNGDAGLPMKRPPRPAPFFPALFLFAFLRALRG